VNDEYYMKQAIALAQKGRLCQPQSMVGAVIVKNGQIIDGLPSAFRRKSRWNQRAEKRAEDVAAQPFMLL